MARPSRVTSRSRDAKRAADTTPRTIAGKAESLLTAAERKLLDGTVGRSLAEATGKQLQAIMTRARRLRDKWRDLFDRQMRSARRAPQRAGQANSRSLDKAELFAAAVRRIEARLGELAGGGEAGVAAGRAVKDTPRSALSKKARQAGARKMIAGAGGLVDFDRTKQRSARTSATATRIRLDGLSTRRRGHTLAAGRRKQARRDGR